MIKVLLQTTIEPTADDWSIARFALLAQVLADERDATGRAVFDVTARDRGPRDQPDPVLSALDSSDFDQLWLFAVDTGDGLTPQDVAAIDRFRQQGGGLLVTRDHMDLGCSVCSLADIGAAHYFHSSHPDPDADRNRIDDPHTTQILWPNYHSGSNGDFQRIRPVGAVHPVLLDPHASSGHIEYLPSHPHEGGIGAPAGSAHARVIARGRSSETQTEFNIAVAFEPSADAGPAIAQSTFHHFVDYNWDPRRGKPSFVTEAAGEAILNSPAALASTHRYVSNLAHWLAG